MNDLATEEFVSGLIYQIAASLGNPEFMDPLKLLDSSHNGTAYILVRNGATKQELRHASLLWLEHQHKMPTPGDLLMLIKAQRAGESKHLCAARAA